MYYCFCMPSLLSLGRGLGYWRSVSIADTTLNCITRNGRTCLESHIHVFGDGGGVGKAAVVSITHFPSARQGFSMETVIPRRLFSFFSQGLLKSLAY
ncbi:Protein of unknown function [Pyronema omphalodes CBS 100304]|uniref:Uncharacterized protein n=1 Tax=Pyronema omphalodes (strain CBS 100304) TaxID=1076935 RepID=U4LFR0_PYROM|nr:Protein of unknown function [Pyronema omphalodes CBS 100304]